jgi:hypothetical protein
MRKFNLFNVILYVALNLDTRLVSAVVACSLCKGGVSFNKDMSDKLVELPVGKTTISLSCAALDSAIPLSLHNASSEDCLLIQSLGSLCGCPVEEDACKLCTDGTEIVAPNNTLPFLEEQFGFVPTCGLLEAYLLSQNATNNTLCSVSQGLLAEYCGCNGATIAKGCSFCPDGQMVPSPEKELNISDLPFKTCGQLESALSLVIEDGQETCTTFQKLSSYCGCQVAENACKMCPHGEISYPDKSLLPIVGNAGIDSFEPTCKIFEALARSTLVGTNECFLAHLISGYCGCPPLENYCSMCHGKGIPIEFQAVILSSDILKKIPAMHSISSITCDDAESFLSQVDRDDMICYTSQMRGDLCGCSRNGYGYFGTSEHPERRIAFPWITRMSSLLSIIAVILISLDILSDKKKIRNVYCRLMLGMSVFDLLSNFGWLASSSAIPYDVGEPIYGASGNEATCKAQCFFLQLGIGGIFYNVSLSTYYYMVVIMSKRETWLKAQEWWLHGIPVGVGLIIAFASIPFASNNYYACHIHISPKELDWISYGLFVFPVGFVVVYCTTVTSYICWSIKQQSKVVKKWRFPSRQSLANSKTTAENAAGIWNKRKTKQNCGKRKIATFSILQNQVMWQSLLYLVAFWCTWPLFVISFVASDAITKLSEPWQYIYFVVSLMLAPLQGFLNGFFYFRSKIGQKLCKRRIESKVDVRPNPQSTFVASIKETSSWNRISLLSWTFKHMDNNDKVLKKSNSCNINQIYSQNSKSDGKIKVERSIRPDQLSSAHDVDPFDLSKCSEEVSNTKVNAFLWGSNSLYDDNSYLGESDRLDEDTEMSYIDPSILLAAMTLKDESENDVFMDISQVQYINEDKEFFN